jgi:hypothetical protein
MPAPPLRTALSDTYPNPSNAVMRTGMGALWDYVTTLLGADGSAGAARTALGALAKAGDTLTGALNFNTAATVASATTTNIGAAASNMVSVTGTTTITGFGTIAAGALRTVTFTGALTLTHNATTLILPGAANITTAAGDSGIFISLGSGNWRCLSYQRASGVAVVVAAVASASESAQGIVELATSAEALAGTDTARAVTPAGLRAGLSATGTAPVFAARAWVNFNGTGTPAVRASGNVSSLTDNTTGDYTINFTTAMPDANYAVSGGHNYMDAYRGGILYVGNSIAASGTVAPGTAPETVSKLTTSCRVQTIMGIASSAPVDANSINVMFFR